jgi:hypothetical protein
MNFLTSACAGALLLSTLQAQSFLTEETAFELVFQEMQHVDANATALEQKGASAADLRNRYKYLFGLDADADKVFKSVAKNCLSETQTLDARAAQIIAAAKAKFRPRYGSNERAPRVPAVPPELLSLQQQKTSAIRKWLDVLEGQVGRGRMAMLSADLRRHVSSHTIWQNPTASP